MTTNHPAHGPVSLDRLHQIREILSKAAAQSDGGNLGYAMADAVKVIDGAIAEFGVEPAPVVPDDLLSMAASAIEDLLEHTDPSTNYYSGVWADVHGKLRAAMLQSFGNSEQLDEVGSWNNHMNTPTAQAGNSPIIGIDLASEPDRSVEVRYLAPPGYVIVPIVPTEDMIINGFESVPNPHFSDEKEWEEYEALSGCRQAARRAELCWAAMIKAAPKQENI